MFQQRRRLLQSIFLMVALGQVKYVQRQNRCLDDLAQPAGHRISGHVNDLSLRLVVVPDRCHVLSAESPPQRIVIIPEEFDDFLETDHFRIKVDLQSFCMVSQIVISRRFRFAPRVTHASSIHAFDDPKLGVWSPESAERKRCGLQVLRHCSVDGRNCRHGCRGA